MRGRLLAFAALAAFGLERWAAILAPRQTGRASAAWLLALLLAAVCLGVRRRPGPAGRAFAAGAAVLAAVPGALLLAGVPLRLLAPRNWDALAAGIGRGLAAMPDALIPYLGRGDSWPARTILAGGGLLVALAAWLAFRPRRGEDGPPWAAAVALGALAGVPAVVLSGDRAILLGLVLLAGLVALLTTGSGAAGEPSRRPEPRVAPVLLVLAAVTASLLFPALDSGRPWFAYEAAAQSLLRPPERFSFSHTYGPIRWSRSGRELLRIRAARSGYWKAADLETFDGRRWLTEPAGDGPAAAADLARVIVRHPAWRRRVAVTVRGLASADVVAPGAVLSVSASLGGVGSAGTPGRLRWQQTPRDGDVYGLDAYDPRPSRTALASAGTDYPAYTRSLLAVGLGRVGGIGRGSPVIYQAGRWGSGERDGAAGAGYQADLTSADALLRDSDYAGVARLARRLRAGARTPYAYVRRVLAYLSRGFSYTESPPPARVPLAAFLLSTKRGYCQQFSGAMALLLRLGGVPARVAGGFAPGRRDPRTGEWVVTDLDAHSWVEVWFPRIGWVTFDPTPAASPARGQATPNHAPLASRSDVPHGRQGNRDLAQTLRAPRAARSRAAARGARGAGAPAAWLLALILAAALAAGAVVLRVRRRAGRSPRAEAGLAELERALRRAGRPARGGTTLRELEARLARTEPAAGYVRALGALRFGAAGSGPTPAERRGLRRELARGLGPLGALRSWWALPPRI